MTGTNWISYCTGTYDGRGGTSANNGLKTIYINGSSQII